MSNELMSKIIETAKEMKSELCDEHKGPADGTPIILGVAKGGEPFLMPDILDGHPTDNLALLLQQLSSALKEKHGTMEWEWLAYIVEGYINEDAQEFERGLMERDFKNNPASTVKESIIASLFTWNGENIVQSVTYTYGDDGLPVWDTVMDSDEAIGIVPFIFTSFRTFCQTEGTK